MEKLKILLTCFLLVLVSQVSQAQQGHITLPDNETLPGMSLLCFQLIDGYPQYTTGTIDLYVDYDGNHNFEEDEKISSFSFTPEELKAAGWINWFLQIYSVIEKFQTIRSKDFVLEILGKYATAIEFLIAENRDQFILTIHRILDELSTQFGQGIKHLPTLSIGFADILYDLIFGGRDTTGEEKAKLKEFLRKLLKAVKDNIEKIKQVR